MSVCVYWSLYTQIARGVQKRALAPLELELQAVGSFHVDAENHTRCSVRAPVPLTGQPAARHFLARGRRASLEVLPGGLSSLTWTFPFLPPLSCPPLHSFSWWAAWKVVFQTLLRSGPLWKSSSWLLCHKEPLIIALPLDSSSSWACPLLPWFSLLRSMDCMRFPEYLLLRVSSTSQLCSWDSALLPCCPWGKQVDA